MGKERNRRCRSPLSRRQPPPIIHPSPIPPTLFVTLPRASPEEEEEAALLPGGARKGRGEVGTARRSFPAFLVFQHRKHVRDRGERTVACRGFAAVKPEQAETRFSAVSAPVVSRLEAGGGGGGGRASGRPAEGTTRGVSPLTARWKQERLLGRAELGLRACAFLFSLISFSVMASDKTQGWSGDSYYRYSEYRYVVGVNVIVFVYSGVQIMAYVYGFSGGNLVLRRFTISLGFAADQILAYLLMSASSSAASLTEDTQALWGKDPFTSKAGGSVAISFLAFTALALSALTSGYHMYNCL